MNDNNKKNIPTHVSIIMDGNGRWAKSRGQQRWAGHIEGVESVKDVLRAAGDAGVKYLSLYAFSEENWNRSEDEVRSLMTLMFKSMLSNLPMMQQEKVRFVVLGNRDRLGEELCRTIDETMAATASNDKITFIIFLSYSGKWDILQAVKKLAAEGRSPEEISMEDLDNNLVTAGIPDPDLIIRTSGEQRISNYLLWQAAYSEFFFTSVLWPDFRRKEFMEALEEYSRRDRRYGKTK